MNPPETITPPAVTPPAVTPAAVTPAPPDPQPAPDVPASGESPNPAQGLGTYELLRSPGADDGQVTPPDDDVTAYVLSRRSRSVWDL